MIIVTIAGFYLLSPLLTSSELNDVDPLGYMNDMEKEQFTQEMQKMENITTEMNDPMERLHLVPYEGTFMEHGGHRVAGIAKVIDIEDEKILRFENFDTVNGPNLHIYLSTNTSDEDFIDLGKIKATKGNINYALPADIDIEKYNHVLVWCVPFSVLFSYAKLQ